MNPQQLLQLVNEAADLIYNATFDGAISDQYKEQFLALAEKLSKATEENK